MFRETFKWLNSLNRSGHPFISNCFQKNLIAKSELSLRCDSLLCDRIFIDTIQDPDCLPHMLFGVGLYYLLNII